MNTYYIRELETGRVVAEATSEAGAKLAKRILEAETGAKLDVTTLWPTSKREAAESTR